MELALKDASGALEVSEATFGLEFNEALVGYKAGDKHYDKVNDFFSEKCSDMAEKAKQSIHNQKINLAKLQAEASEEARLAAEKAIADKAKAEEEIIKQEEEDARKQAKEAEALEVMNVQMDKQMEAHVEIIDNNKVPKGSKVTWEGEIKLIGSCVEIVTTYLREVGDVEKLSKALMPLVKDMAKLPERPVIKGL